MRLSPHFTSEEFACHDGTLVPPSSLPAVRALCLDLLEPLRRVHGAVLIVSGYRTASYNRRVGGAPHSFHVYDHHRVGVAADINCARGTPAEWAQTADRLGVGGLGIYTGHVHVDSRLGRARWFEPAS